MFKVLVALSWRLEAFRGVLQPCACGKRWWYRSKRRYFTVTSLPVKSKAGAYHWWITLMPLNTWSQHQIGVTWGKGRVFLLKQFLINIVFYMLISNAVVHRNEWYSSAKMVQEKSHQGVSMKVSDFLTNICKICILLGLHRIYNTLISINYRKKRLMITPLHIWSHSFQVSQQIHTMQDKI